MEERLGRCLDGIKAAKCMLENHEPAGLAWALDMIENELMSALNDHPDQPGG